MHLMIKSSDKRGHMFSPSPWKSVTAESFKLYSLCDFKGLWFFLHLLLHSYININSPIIIARFALPNPFGLFTVTVDFDAILAHWTRTATTIVM